MAEQLDLVARPVPPVPEGIDLRCCDVVELFDEDITANLVVADPPWSYSAGRPGHGRAADHYECLTPKQIRSHIYRSYECAADDAYLALWCTWPLLGEWMEASRKSILWKYVTGGAWGKTRGMGTGYHWRGNSEMVLLYKKGKPKPHATIVNLHLTDRQASGVKDKGGTAARHSEKPLDWARDHVRAFCPPGGLVLELYAGMAPYARAAHLEGRRYLGCEIDPERHAAALGLLAQVRP